MASSLGYDGGLTCAIEVSDFKRALQWYQDVLGFKVQYVLEEMGWAELETEIPRVAVGISQVEGKPGGKGGATLTFGVMDIEAARKQVEAKGVRFDGETRTIEGMVKLATFFGVDPASSTSPGWAHSALSTQSSALSTVRVSSGWWNRWP